MATKMMSLADLIPGWPTDAPETGAALVATEYDALVAAHPDPTTQALVVGMRRLFLDAVQKSSRIAVTSPAKLVELLKAGKVVRLQAHRWKIMVLDADRFPVLVPDANHGARYLTETFNSLPPAEVLADKLPLEPGYSYIVLFGNGPEMLEMSGISETLVAYRARFDVTDIVFDRIREGERIIFSVRAGRGADGSTSVPFPNESALAAVRGGGSW